jgi:hypothetical protein
MPTDFEVVLESLSQAKVRFVVVGGVAVVLHGHLRFTADLDLVVALDTENALRAIGALSGLDYKPRAPVPATAFADPAARASWARDKGMIAFTLVSPRFPATEVDLFIETPVPFDELESRALRVTLGSTEVRVAGTDDLVAMKTTAGRPKDLQDVTELKRLAALRENEKP